MTPPPGRDHDDAARWGRWADSSVFRFWRQSWVERFRQRLTDRTILSKILIALTITLGIIVGIYTYLILRIQDRWSEDRFAATCVIAAQSVQEQFSRSLIHGFSSARHPPVSLHAEAGWPRIWVVDDSQRMLASTESGSVGRRWDSSMASRRSMALVPLPNRMECRTCHDPGQASLARILMAPGDRHPAIEQTVQHGWLLGYGFLMAVLTLVGMTFCLIHFVRHPLERLAGLMDQAQAGDLSVRFAVRGRDEVSQLGRGFNRMIHSLAGASASLQISYRRQIQQAEKLASVGELASGLAHEIRNPLAGIKTAVEVLSEKIASRDVHGSNDDLKEVVQEVGVQIDRIHRLVGDLLRYVRPKPPQTMSCDLRDLLRRCLGLLRPQAEKQGIVIEMKDVEGDHEICADPGQIEQAILNISLNAIQAMPKGGTLRYAICRDMKEGFLILQIEDTGEGMSPEVQQQIFSPFYTTKKGGTGLGLSITRGIIEGHHGSLTFSSERGRGTTFTLRLPLLRVHGCGGSDSATRPPGGTISKEEK